LERELESPLNSPLPAHGSAWDPQQAENVQQELLRLRKDAGFTATRLARAPMIRQLLGGNNESFEAMRERIVSAIHSLHEPQPELLLDAFALSPGTSDMRYLKQRRQHYGQKHGIKIEAVADREAPALDRLRAQLVTGWYPKSPAGFPVPQSHNGFVQEAVSILTIVRNRQWLETRERYRLIAAFDEADYISISSSFPGRPIPEGDFTVRTKRIGQSFTHQFWHKEPMRRGQIYELNFRLVPDSDYGEPGALTEESRAFHEPTRFAAFRAIFLGNKPPIIWSYRGLSYFERPGSPSTGQMLHFGSDPGITAAFHDLYGGLHSGIAWRW
jgi:hypothetical protein